MSQYECFYNCIDISIKRTFLQLITTCPFIIRFTLSYRLIVDKKFIICLLKTVIYPNHFMKFSPESC